MKKTLFSLLFLFAASGLLFAQDTLYIYYNNDWAEVSDKSEAVYYRKAFPAGNSEWIVNDFYMNDKIQMTGTYKSKKFTVRNGHFVYYSENGNKASEGEYINEKLEGLWTYWHDNGQKKAEGMYGDSEKAGTWNYWYDNGRLQSKETYKKAGSGSIEGFHENGVTSFKGNFGINGPQGTWMYWNSDGRVTFSGNFKNGLREGEWTRSFRDGETKIVYKYGVPEGKRTGGIVRNE